MSSQLFSQRTLARAIMDIGEGVEIYYEPRNVGTPWYVGLCDAHGKEMPIHDHFADLFDGLKWLKQATMKDIEVDK